MGSGPGVGGLGQDRTQQGVSWFLVSVSASLPVGSGPSSVQLLALSWGQGGTGIVTPALRGLLGRGSPGPPLPLPDPLHLASCFVFRCTGGTSLHLGEMEFAGKCRAIISVPCEWETELGERQISWQGETAECASPGIARILLG